MSVMKKKKGNDLKSLRAKVLIFGGLFLMLFGFFPLFIAGGQSNCCYQDGYTECYRVAESMAFLAFPFGILGSVLMVIGMIMGRFDSKEKNDNDFCGYFVLYGIKRYITGESLFEIIICLNVMLFIGVFIIMINAGLC